MYYAIQNNDLGAVKAIMKEGYDLSKTDDYNSTALRWAIQKGNPEIAEVLIKNGADVNKVNAAGQTPLHMAVSAWSMKTIEILLKNGADPKKNRDGKTPRKHAKKIKYKDAARYLKRAEKGQLNF